MTISRQVSKPMYFNDGNAWIYLHILCHTTACRVAEVLKTINIRPLGMALRSAYARGRPSR